MEAGGAYLVGECGRDGAWDSGCGRLADDATVELSIVIPAYNEAERLPSMLDETVKYVTGRSAQDGRFTWEIIIVDDGSTDATASAAQSVANTLQTGLVRVLKLGQNVGKGGAVRQGVLEAKGRYVLMADADAATVFEEVEKLEEGIRGEGVEVVVGSRSHLRGRRDGGEQGRGLLRGFVSFVFHWFVVMVGGVRGVGDTQCGFKLYSRKAARVAFGGQMLRRWAFDVENLYRVQVAGFEIREVAVRWTEVPGSKLSVVRATVNMIWDMGRMRYQYLMGNWKVE